MRNSLFVILLTIAIIFPPVSWAQDADDAVNVRDLVLSENLETEENTEKPDDEKVIVESKQAETAPPAEAVPQVITQVIHPPTAASDPFLTLKRMATGQFWLILGKFAIALILLLTSALLGRLVEGLTFRFLVQTRIAQKVIDFFDLGVILNRNNTSEPIEKRIAKLGYYILIGIAVVLSLQVVGFDYSPFQDILDKIQTTAWNSIAALIWLILAFTGGRALQGITTRVFDSFDIDRRIRELSKAPPEPTTWASRILHEEDGIEHEKLFSQNAGKVSFWIVMLLGLALAFESLEIGSIADPLTESMNRIIGMLPSLALGAVLIFGGYLLGRISSAIAHNLLHSAGFDGVITKVKLQTLFGGNQPSYIVGVLIHIFIVLQAIIAALEELGLTTLSEPLTEMMARFWLLIPDLGFAVLIGIVGLTASRVLKGIVITSLKSFHFDQRLRQYGFQRLQGTILEEPSEILGFVAQASIVMIALAQVFQHLGLNLWANYVNDLLDYGLTRLLVAIIVAAIGYGIATHVERLLIQQAKPTTNPWIAPIARYAILVFAFTAAIRHLEIANDFVIVAFGLMFGSLCLALALAFGLGSRDVAADIVRKQYELSLQTRGGAQPPPSKPSPNETPKRDQAQAAAYAKQSNTQVKSKPVDTNFRWENLPDPNKGQVKTTSPPQKSKPKAPPTKATAPQQPVKPRKQAPTTRELPHAGQRAKRPKQSRPPGPKGPPPSDSEAPSRQTPPQRTDAPPKPKS